MRIKHTPNELYIVYNYYPCTSDLFKDIKRWHPYKAYTTKQGALKAIKRLKNKEFEKTGKNNLIWKIVWLPCPYASLNYSVTVYNEDKEN